VCVKSGIVLISQRNAAQIDDNSARSKTDCDNRATLMNCVVPPSYQKREHEMMDAFMRSRRQRRLTACALMWVLASGALITAIANAATKNGSSQDSAAAHDDGRSVFVQCGACHALAPSRNGRGPTLYHLFGRKAGTVPGYGYSVAMKSAGIVWREDTLRSFILAPQRVVPGTTMTFTFSADPQQIRELIEYLRTATH
jgi:cytochrome c